MGLNETIVAVIISVSLIIGFTFLGFNNSKCKIEAIKAGMKVEEVRKACY